MTREQADQLVAAFGEYVRLTVAREVANLDFVGPEARRAHRELVDALVAASPAEGGEHG